MKMCSLGRMGSLILVGFLSNHLKIVSCCSDEMHTEQSDVIVYSCLIMHRCMNTCMLGSLSLFGDQLLSPWSQLIDKSHISESNMLCLKPLDTLLSALQGCALVSPFLMCVGHSMPLITPQIHRARPLSCWQQQHVHFGDL